MELQKLVFHSAMWVLRDLSSQKVLGRLPHLPVPVLECY